ncbi:TOMM precursor leader peptide-binding protein [Tistrella mobilis]|jgi:bacteriocin biosynthesis cyclodehydratase domain-containing protein
MKRLHPAVHCRPAGDAGVSIIDTPLGTLRIREDPQVLVGRLPDSPDKAALVGFLEEEGIVVDDGPVLPDATLDEAGFLARRRPDPAAIGSLAVVGEGRIARSARARLTGWGCDVVDFIADHASAVLACSDREDHVFLLEANQTAIAAGVPITFCAVWRSTITLGPTVLPGETACYACFERRRHARLLHPTAHAALHRPPAVGELAAGPTPSDVVTTLAGELGALQLAMLALGLDGDLLFSEVSSFDVLRTKAGRHHVSRLPRCTACAGFRARHRRAAWDTMGLTDDDLANAR